MPLLSLAAPFLGLGTLEPWLFAAGAGGFLALLLYVRHSRRRRRATSILFRELPADAPAFALAPATAPGDGGAASHGWLRGWLTRAGMADPGAPARFMLLMLGAALCSAFLALTFDASGFSDAAVTWLEGVPGGFASIFVPVMRAGTWLIALLVVTLPVVWVRRQRQRRVDEVERDMPTVLSLLASLVESGMGFDAAAQRVEQALGQERVLAVEFARMRSATMAGVPRATAIRTVAQELDVPSLLAFSSALIHAESQGASLGETLRRQATDLWARRREEAIQRAQVLPTKLAFPLVICFLPGVFVWTFGPAVAEFVRLAGSALAGQP